MEIDRYYRGKGQPMDCQVYSPNGWINLGDVKINDSVLAKDGSFTSIIGLYEQLRSPSYVITFEDGRSTKCGLNHLWRLYHARWKKAHVQPTSFLLSLNESELKDFSIDLFNPELNRMLDNTRRIMTNKSILESYVDEHDNIVMAQETIWSLGGIAYIEENNDNESTINYAFKDDSGNDLKLKIKAIYYDGEQDSQCIKVSHRDYLYVMDNYIITHNGIDCGQ